MKNLIKRMLVNMIFTAEERNVMINALDYSELRYRRRGNTDRALLVGIVKSHIQGFFKPGKETVNQDKNKTETETEQSGYMTKRELMKLIVKMAAATAAFTIEKIREEIVEVMNDYEKENGVEEVEVYIQKHDIEKCTECESKEKCFIYRNFSGNTNVDEKPEEKHNEPENGENKSESQEPPTFEESCCECKMEK